MILFHKLILVEFVLKKNKILSFKLILSYKLIFSEIDIEENYNLSNKLIFVLFYF